MKRLNVLLTALGLLIGSVGAVTGIRMMEPPPPAPTTIQSRLEQMQPFSGMTHEEEYQQPQVADLPCHDGQMFVYKFATRDIRRDEGLFMIASHLMYSEVSNEDLSNKVRIVILTGPNRTLLLTADNIAGELELREEWNQRDKYRQWTWKGDDLTTIAKYLMLGVKTSDVKFERGRRTYEKTPTIGETQCSPRTGA